MYIGAGLDMLAHIYDKHLNYITSLPTGERVIRHILYNEKLDEIIIVGSGGCKSWKLERSFSNGLASFNLHVVAHYTKDGESHWVNHIEFDGDSQRLICIEEEVRDEDGAYERRSEETILHKPLLSCSSLRLSRLS